MEHGDLVGEFLVLRGKAKEGLLNHTELKRWTELRATFSAANDPPPDVPAGDDPLEWMPPGEEDTRD